MAVLGGSIESDHRLSIGDGVVLNGELFGL